MAEHRHTCSTPELQSFKHDPEDHPYWPFQSPYTVTRLSMHSHKDRWEWEGKRKGGSSWDPKTATQACCKDLETPYWRTGVTSSSWSCSSSGQGPSNHTRLWRPLLCVDGVLTFLAERKQGIFPGGSAVTQGASRRGTAGRVCPCPFSWLSTAGFLPADSHQQESLDIWEGQVFIRGPCPPLRKLKPWSRLAQPHCPFHLRCPLSQAHFPGT